MRRAVAGNDSFPAAMPRGRLALEGPSGTGRHAGGAGVRSAQKGASVAAMCKRRGGVTMDAIRRDQRIITVGLHDQEPVKTGLKTRVQVMWMGARDYKNFLR